jgi:hypothetical protein
MTDQEIKQLLGDIAEEAKHINLIYPGTQAADPKNYSFNTVRNATSILQREVNLLLEADRLLNAALATMIIRTGPTGCANIDRDGVSPAMADRDAVMRQAMWWIRLVAIGRQRAIVEACDGYVHPGIVTCFEDQFGSKPTPSPVSVHANRFDNNEQK